MKTIKIIAAAMVMLTMGTTQAQAQGLGGLLKKVKKVMNVVVGDAATSTSTTTNMQVKSMEMPIEGGGTLRNPIPDVADIQLVGVYGKSTSTNYGRVSLVFKVNMKANLQNISFGSNSDYPALLVDENGNTYKTNIGWYEYSVTEGILMNVPIKEGSDFLDVKKTSTIAQQLQFGVSTGKGRGVIILKNVPIQWDVEH